MDDHDPRPTSPTRRSGKGRLEAFSDGVFAIAITLLVLDLVIPKDQASVHDLWGAALSGWAGYLGYLVSFATIGAIWLGHNAITELLEQSDPVLLRLNLILLLFVSLLPFSTRLLSEFFDTPAEPVASTIYGLTLLISAILLSAVWRYAVRAGLIKRDVDDDEITLLTQRLTPGLGGYVVLIVLGVFFPAAAVVGYLLLALFLLIPFRLRPEDRGPRGERRPSRRAKRSARVDDLKP